MSIRYNGKLVPYARELRKNATRQEKHLWYDYLCEYPVRFQRQKTIDGFIVDFYCHKARLIIEIDGSQHYSEEGMAYDKDRTAILSRYNLTVQRFSNNDIDKNFEGVCILIDKIVKERLQ